MGKRRSLLCERCAPGRGGPGPDPDRGYAAPIPGDTKGWGCRGGSCGPAAESQTKEFAGTLSKVLLGQALVVLGFPKAKVRSLFDYERIAWERNAGKRSTRRTRTGPPSSP